MTGDTQRETILVVDDNACICDFVKNYLESAGYTVITASDGEEGLRVFEKYRSSIRLLITDVLMPKINGFELVDYLLGVDPQLRILFMSGDVWYGYRGLECVLKPFRLSELGEIVHRVLSANTYPESQTISRHSTNWAASTLKAFT
jgi:DNA-binding response OmpR family regulator